MSSWKKLAKALYVLGFAYSEVSNYGIRVEVVIKGIDQECLILLAILDGRRGLGKCVFGGIHKDLVKSRVEADLNQQCVERLDAVQFPLHTQRVSKGVEGFEVAEYHR